MSKAKPIIQKGPAEGEVITHLSFLDSVMEQSPFAMWISDVKGTVIRTNGALRQTLDLTDDRIVGKYNVLEDDNLKEQGVMNQVRAVFEDRRTARFSIPWIPGKAGNVDFRGARDLWIDVSIFPVVNGDGKLTHVVCQWIDITERKQKENALRVSEEKYRDLVENMVDVIFILDTTGQVTSINPSVKAMLGFEPEEVIGRHFTNWIPPDQQAVIMPIFKRILAGETIIDETVLIGKDGKPRDAEFRASCISRDGQVVGVQGILRDITEQKRAAEALQEREAFLNTLLDAIPIPVFYKDREGRYLGFNRAFEQFIGATKKELIGKSVFDINPPELAEIYHAKDNELLVNGGAQQYESRVKNAQDIVRDVIFNKAAYTDNRGVINGLIGTILDITDFKRAQREIESLSKFPSENPSPVLRVERDGVLLYGNQAALPLLAELDVEVGGIVSPRWSSLIDEALESATPRIHEEDIGGRIFSFVIAPVIDEDYVNLYGRDITECKMNENELRKLNADLVMASRRAGMAEVATDVLHNVGNVLTSINVSASFIKEKLTNSKAVNLKKVMDILKGHTGDLGTFLTEDERGQHIPLYLTEVARFVLDEQAMIAERVQSLTRNVEHLMHIIKAQQSYAKTGSVEVLASVDEIVEDALEINRAALKKYGINLDVELNELPKIQIDKQRVLQILVNLITNAKHALAESAKPEKVLTIRSSRYGEDKVRIEVTDNGVGIAPENMPRMFTYGFTTKKKGHGFGLHSSAVAAREMGGSLTVHSDGPGNGANFTLELPLTKSGAITDGCIES